MISTEPEYIRLNKTYSGEMPFSEVCLHMRVAGKVLQFRLRRPRRLNGKIARDHPPVAQLYRNGRPWSAPIGFGEAGVYQHGQRYYFYPPV